MMTRIKSMLLKSRTGFVKDALVGAYSYYLGRAKYGTVYRQEVQRLRETRAGTSEMAQQEQKRKLIDLLQYVRQHNPFFGRLLEELEISDKDIPQDPFDVLAQLPIIEKSFLKENSKELTDPSLSHYMTVSTSGTTGSPMSVPFDKAGYQRTFAYWRAFYDVMGLPENFRNVRFSGRVISDDSSELKPWVYDWYEKRLFMSSFHLTEKHMPAYVKKLDEFKPQLIDGFPSAIEVLAEYIVRRNIELKFKPLAIATTAEVISQEQRELIERAFGCKVYNQYASSEGAPFITECEKGSLHLNIDTGIFELEEMSAGEKGLIVTSFRNYKLPLIRYRIGDTVVTSDEKVCSCGSPFPIVESIGGRKDDVLFSVERGPTRQITTLFKGIDGLKRAQIVQHNLYDFTILLEPVSDPQKIDTKRIEKNFAERLGQNVNISIEIVEQIPLTKSGKFRPVINYLKPEMMKANDQ